MRRQSFVAQGDRAGLAEEMAKTYADHDISKANDQAVTLNAARPDRLSSLVAKELRTKRATTTGFFYALLVILKVT